LPARARYAVELSLTLAGQAAAPIVVELKQTNGREVVFAKKYAFENRREAEIYDMLSLLAEGGRDNYLSLRLMSQNPLEIRYVSIKIV
jgi:hypothetical protein